MEALKPTQEKVEDISSLKAALVEYIKTLLKESEELLNKGDLSLDTIDKQLIKLGEPYFDEISKVQWQIQQDGIKSGKKSFDAYEDGTTGLSKYIDEHIPEHMTQSIDLENRFKRARFDIESKGELGQIPEIQELKTLLKEKGGINVKDLTFDSFSKNDFSKHLKDMVSLSEKIQEIKEREGAVYSRLTDPDSVEEVSPDDKSKQLRIVNFLGDALTVLYHIDFIYGEEFLNKMQKRAATNEEFKKEFMDRLNIIKSDLNTDPNQC
ncbi:MAG: hypothetical protein HY225_03085 [Candidatus Vogelbacteria bacterium]|nr:hypothetical protein [Candidatus Vogelbacteria bacterium]